MKHISLLRGINVSGQKKVKMVDLKALYESLGFNNVVTYIQSGNVIFDTDIKDHAALCRIIEKGIERKYKFHVPTIIRSSNELESAMKNNPFEKIDLEKDGSKILITFMDVKPDKSKLNDLLDFVGESEKLIARGKELYLHCPDGHGKSKLSNTFIEKKLGLVATTRNLKSVHKIYSLSMSP